MSNSASRKRIRPKPLHSTAARLSDSEARLSPEFNSDLYEAATVGRLYPRELSLSELFEAQVERTPRATALVYGDKQFSYRELNERANKLAHYLIQSEVKAEDRIGILMERTPAMIVSLLSALKAGGCYVPLDPQYPRERLEFMRADAGLRVLLTTSALAEVCGVGQNEGLRLVYVEEVEQAASSENLGVAVSEKQLAYLIYTSGSTGVPKGVAITHGSAESFIHWASERFDQQALSGVLFSTSICFDLSIFEVFVTLSNGGKVILAENALQLPELAAVNQVTLINTVPSAMAALVRMSAVPTSVRVVNLAGEALRPELVAEIYANTQVQEVYNLYGPSEDTTYSTYTLVRAGERVTIGRPIANTRAYVLDEQWQIVPVGVAGELHLGGKGLARGYWQRPELTAANFIPDHFSGEPGARLYRTGDQARYLPSGELDFLGRMDHQVKVRGFRIELGEIEAVLASHPGLLEAVVVVKKEDKSGAERLVAYVVGEGEEAVGKVLRGYLRERLPEFMVPQAFVSLSSLPLTPNGKVDRRALQGLEVEFESSGDQSVMARTPVEEILSGIWAEVLGCETVSVDDSFLELGGHSLLATQVISRIRSVFGQEVALRALLENPTVASLARTIEGGQLIVSGPKAPPIVRVERNGSAPASFAQQHFWLLHQFEPDSVFYNMPTVTKLTGTLNFVALEDALTEIIRRHEVLRTTVTSVDGEPWQIISPPEPFRLPLIDLSELPDKARETETLCLIGEEAQRPMDLLLRGKVLRLGAEEHVVLLTAHSFVLDLESIGILIREIATLYRAFCEGRPSPLEELPVQYADFAHWQRQWFQGEVFEQQLHYWRQQLAGAPAALELKGRKPAPPILTSRVAKQMIEISKESVQKLRELGRQTGVTLYMSLLAAFNVLLYRYSGQTDLLVGTPVINRNHLETEPLIGFFLNTLVFRADLSGDPTFIEVLHRVREVCLEAFAHQEMPFVKLVEELQPNRSQYHSPLFQVLFVLHNKEVDALDLPGLSLRTYQEEETTAKFDLLLTLSKTNNGIAGFLKYNTDIFDDSAIANMAKHFQTLIENLLADPQQHLSDTSFLSEDETMGLTSADFPESGLSQKDFESLILQLNSSSSLK
jgi:amino acid adenylation domain-containing protein